MIELVPINFDEAKEFVRKFHRHHRSPIGHKYSIAASVDGVIVGVVIVGRPVARRLDNGFTLEVTRLCTTGERNVCSFLYSAAWRVAKNLGYRRLITYIGKDEPGTSLAAAGWKALYETPGKSWSVKSRPRIDKHPLQQRIIYEAQ